MSKSLQKLLEFFGIKNSQDKVEPQEFYAEDKLKLENGEEIRPPWIRYSSTLSPWELRHDDWLINIWLVFWRRLSVEARESYRIKWNMPEDWYEVVTMFWTDMEKDSNKFTK